MTAEPVTVVLAHHYRQAREWAYTNGVRRFRYPMGDPFASMLGLHAPDVRIVALPGWSEHRRARDVREVLARLERLGATVEYPRES